MGSRDKLAGVGGGAQVRVASEPDAAPIAAVTNAAFAVETFLEGMRTDARRVLEMMRQGVFLVCAGKDDQIVASIYMETRGARGYFGMLAVDPLYQGKGLGARMVQAAEDYCRERKCTAMDITVLSLRPELLPFYHRLGYAETGKEEFRPSRPMRAGAECYSILMSKNL
jgi:GNAT superfamily N-acetyltransferase